MRFYFVLIALFTLLQINSANAQSSMADLITDPSVSLRCKELIKDRNSKVLTKQRMKDLLKRNEKMITKTPRHKKTVLSKLRLAYQELRNEIYLINIVIRNMEENIVRKGCPGIRL
jgi:hypothetical protein